MTGTIQDLLVGLGFKVDSTQLEQFQGQIAETRGIMLGLGAIFTGAAAGIGLMVERVAASMGEMHDFAELNTMTAREVAALGRIASENDSSLEAMKSTIQSLNSNIGQAALGVGRGAMLFQKLGLQAKNADGSVRTVDDLLGDIADKMAGLSRQEQLAMAERLGIDPQLVKLLEQGSDNLARLREEAELFNPFSNEEYALADEVDKLFIKAKNTLGVFTKQIAVGLMPVVRDTLRLYLEWFRATRRATDSAFRIALESLTNVMARVFQWFVLVIRGVAGFVKWLIDTKVVALAAAAALVVFASVGTYNMIMKIVGGLRAMWASMVAVNTQALLIPALIGAAVLLVIALIDDLVAYAQGGESVIGDLVAEFPALGVVLKEIGTAAKDAFVFLSNAARELLPSIQALGGAIWSLVKTIAGALWPVVQMIFKGWAYLLVAVFPYLLALGTFVVWLATTIIETLVAAITYVVDALRTGVETMAGILSALGDFFSAVFGGFVTAALTAFTAIGGAWDAVAGGIRTAFSAAIEWVLGLIDGAKERLFGFADSVTGAFRKVGEFLGIAPKDATVNAGGQQTGSAVARAVAQAPALGGMGDVQRMAGLPALATPGGIIGKAEEAAANSTQTSTTTQTTTVNAPITINSTDPERAGESVRRELDRVNKQATRNGQTAVAL